MKSHHIEAVFTALKAALGSNIDELFTDQVKESPFGGGPRSWIKVRNHDTPECASVSSEEMVERSISWIISQWNEPRSATNLVRFPQFSFMSS